MTTIALTQQTIDSVIEALPLQGRIMLHLLLLQYFDISREEIEYMAADRPDPRLQAGAKLQSGIIPRETIQGIIDRVGQYRQHVRQRRERLWLQGEYFRRQVARNEIVRDIAERLLTTRFGYTQEALQDLKAHARVSVPRPAIRALETRWEQNEVSEEDYRARRLAIEYQTCLRRLDRDRKRLDAARRDLDTAGLTPLQDHEVAHIWGIPSGALAARKVKYLQLYLEGLQRKLGGGTAPATSGPPANLWRESFVVLSQRPVERAMVAYDGLEFTEEALVEKLTLLATGTMPEEVESRFWPAVQKSLFALQRLFAIQSELDLSTDAVEQDLMHLAAPTPKEVAGVLEDTTQSVDPKKEEMREHVLRSMLGEDRRF